MRVVGILADVDWRGRGVKEKGRKRKNKLKIKE
jgi:hypothetical protein